MIERKWQLHPLGKIPASHPDDESVKVALIDLRRVAKINFPRLLVCGDCFGRQVSDEPDFFEEPTKKRIHDDLLQISRLSEVL